MTELIITTASQSQNWCDPQLPDITLEPRLELNFEDFPQSLEYSSILSTQNDEPAGIINDPPIQTLNMIDKITVLVSVIPPGILIPNSLSNSQWCLYLKDQIHVLRVAY